MRLLLDTCAIVWAIAAPEQLSERATKALTAPGNEIHVSPISCGEIACLCDRGRIELNRHWKPWFNENLEANGWQVVDIDLRIIQEAWSLPDLFHRDPADRILVASARMLGARLVTADRKLLDYPHVETLW